GEEPIGAAHMGKLVLTQRVLKEALRLYPPAPSIARTFNAHLTINGERFAPGDVAVVPIYCLHRHRKLWRDPDLFDPTRFEPEKEKTYSRTQYMPFGAGPRICIGNGFAMMEAIVLLASFARGAKFEWDGKAEPEPTSRVTLRPGGGLKLKVSSI